MTDLRISHIFLMKPFVTLAFTVTLKRNSTCFSETIIFLQIMGPPKTGFEKCILGLEFSGTMLTFRQKSFIYLLAGNVLGAHGQEDSVSTQESPKNAIRWVRGLLKRLLLSRLDRELPAHKLRNEGGAQTQDHWSNPAPPLWKGRLLNESGGP